MAITAANKATLVSGSTGTSFTTSSWTPTAGRFAVVYVETALFGSAPPTPTCAGNSMTYTQIATFVYDTVSTQHRITLFGALTGASPSAGVVTVTVGSNSEGCWAAVDEFIGTAVSSVANTIVQSKNGPIDTTATSVSISLTSTPLAGSATYGGFDGQNATNSAGSGYTQLALISTSQILTEYRGDGQQTVNTGTYTSNVGSGMALELRGAPTDVTVALTGVSSTTAVGSMTPSSAVPLTGISSTTAVGTMTPSESNIALTGVSSTTAVGSMSASSVSVALTGVSTTAAVGTVSVLHSQTLIGVSATSSVGVFVTSGATTAPVPTTRSLLLQGRASEAELFLEAAPGRFQVPPIGIRAHPTTGASSSPLPAVTAAMAGTVANPITGSMASALFIPASAFVGPGSFTPVSGTMASTLPIVTDAMVGLHQQSITGDMASTIVMPRANFTGPSIVNGSMVSQLSPVTSLSVANEVFSGAMASTLSPVTSLGFGLGVFGGALSSLLPVPTAAFNGALQISGVLAATIPAVGAGLSGSVGVAGAVGQMASTLPHLTSAIAGQSTYPATMAATLPHVTSTFAGNVGAFSAPVFTAASPPAASVNVSYSYQFMASGTPPPTFAITSGTLPTGLSLNGSTGVLSGTPSVAGSFTFNITATNSAGTTIAGLTMVVNGFAIATYPVPFTFTNGQVVHFQFTTVGGVAPFTWVWSGDLPAGLTLPTTGLLSGTVNQPFPGNFTLFADLTVSDSVGNTASGLLTFDVSGP